MNLQAGTVLLVVSSLIAGTQGRGCSIGTDTIRLVGGLSDQGLVEICDGNQWMSVCDFLWTDMEAEVVCRELNLSYYSGAQAFSGGGCSAFNMSTSDEGIFIQCTGEERNITECTSAYQKPCIAAGVICSPPCNPSSCNDTDIQCLSPTSTCYCPTPSDTKCTCNEAVCSPACLSGGTCTAPGECLCPPGWTGHICQQAICDPSCSNGGTCTEPNTCQCPDSWIGDHCQQVACNPPCSNGGNCTGRDICQCPDTWVGDHCQYAICNPDFCHNGGTCLYPDENCTCLENWTGKQCNQSTKDSTTSLIPAIVVALVVFLLAVAGIELGILIVIRRRRRRKKAVATPTQSTRSFHEAEPLSNVQSSPAAHITPMQPATTPPVAMGEVDPYTAECFPSNNPHNDHVETELKQFMVESSKSLGDLEPGASTYKYSILATGTQQLAKLNYTFAERQPQGENSDGMSFHSINPYTDFEAFEAEYDETNGYGKPKLDTTLVEVEYDDIQDTQEAQNDQQKELQDLEGPPHDCGKPFGGVDIHEVLYSKPFKIASQSKHDEPHKPRNLYDVQYSKLQHRTPLDADTRHSDTKNYGDPYKFEKTLAAVQYAELCQPQLQNKIIVAGHINYDASNAHKERLQEQLPEYDKPFSPKPASKGNHSLKDEKRITRIFDENYSEIALAEDHMLDQAAPTANTTTNTVFESSAGYSMLTEEAKKLQTSGVYSVLNRDDDAISSTDEGSSSNFCHR